MRAIFHSWIELELAWSKVSTTVCGFTFGSISLSKRITEILTPKHQYNAKYLSRFNDKNAAFRKQKKIYILFPDFSCICIISTPLTFCAFSKLSPPPPPKSSLLKNCTQINVPTHGDLCSIVPMRWTRRVWDFHQMHIPRPSWLAGILGLGLEL